MYRAGTLNSDQLISKPMCHTSTSVADIKYSPRGYGLPRRELQRCTKNKDLMPGKYVLHKNWHFVGMEMWSDGTYIIRPTCRKHVGLIQDWTPGAVDGFSVFQLCPLSMCSETSMDVQGGGGSLEEGLVEFRSLLTGNTLVSCSQADFHGESFAKVARSLCGRSLQQDPFAMVFAVNGEVVPEETSWSDLQSPNTIDIVLVPRTTKLSRKLLAAVRRNSGAEVRTCLCQGQDPNYQYAGGRPALFHASSLGDVAVMEMLLDGGADVDLCAWCGSSCLQFAAMERHADAVQTLLARGANPNHRNNEGMTAANYVVAGLHVAEDVLKMLVLAGADLLLATPSGWNSFTCASDGACLRFVMDCVWSRLTWCDVWTRHLTHIFTFVSASAMAATCKTMRAQVGYLGTFQDCRGDPAAGTPCSI